MAGACLAGIIRVGVVSMMWGGRSGAENSARMDKEKAEVHLAYLQKAISRAIESKDVSGLSAALKAYVAWNGSYYEMQEVKEKEVNKFDDRGYLVTREL